MDSVSNYKLDGGDASVCDFAIPTNQKSEAGVFNLEIPLSQNEKQNMTTMQVCSCFCSVSHLLRIWSGGQRRR